MEEGEIWGRGGGNIFSLVTTQDTSAPHTVAWLKQCKASACSVHVQYLTFFCESRCHTCSTCTSCSVAFHNRQSICLQ